MKHDDAEDSELQRDLEAAHQEATASEARTRRALASRSSTARRHRRNRRVRVLAASAVVLAAGTWLLLRIDGPTAQELRHGREVILRLAEQWTHDYVRQHGEAPKSLATDFPAAKDVQLQQHPEGVRLSIKDEEGDEHHVIVHVAAKR